MKNAKDFGVRFRKYCGKRSAQATLFHFSVTQDMTSRGRQIPPVTKKAIAQRGNYIM